MENMNQENKYIHQMIAVTNRHYIKGCDEALAGQNRALFCRLFVQKVLQVAQLHPKAIVVREKDMEPEDYMILMQNLSNCFADQKISVPLYMHTFLPAGPLPGVSGIHLPLSLLKKTIQQNRTALHGFSIIGTSVHSLSDLAEAERLGATYCFAGNIWETSCKPGKPAAGLDYLTDIVQHSGIPVYAIGGVTIQKMPAILQTGAAGGCMMSGFFKD